MEIFVELYFHPKKNNILKLNQYTKLDKTPCIIYADLESLIKKIDECANHPEKSSTTKVGDHFSWEYSI